MQSTITLPQKVYNSVVLNQSFKLKYTVTMAGERYRPIIVKLFHLIFVVVQDDNMSPNI